MVSLNDILTHLSGCYKTIRINSLAVFDNRWINIATTIQFSKEEHKEEIISHHQEGDLIIIKAVLPFTKISEIKEWLKQARLKFPNLEIHLSQNSDPKDFRQDKFRQDKYLLKEWSVFYYVQLRELLLELKEKIKRDVVKFHYDTLHQLIEYELGVLNRNSPSFIEIGIPIYAKIDSIRMSKDGLEISIIHHREIGSLNLTVEYVDEKGRGIKIKKLRIPVREEVLAESLVKIEYPKITDDLLWALNLTLFHPRLGRIDDKYVLMRDLIARSEIINPPLFSALSIFLPKEKIREKLLNPDNIAKSKLKPQDIFEESICNFLSAAGITSVQLKNHEELKTESRRVIASADALAYDGSGNLFVISCKTSIPDKAEIDKIITTANEIKNRLPSLLKNNVNVIPVIFTLQIAPSQKEEAKKFDVIIVDRNSLENLFQLAQSRKLTYKDFIS